MTQSLRLQLGVQHYHLIFYAYFSRTLPHVHAREGHIGVPMVLMIILVLMLMLVLVTVVVLMLLLLVLVPVPMNCLIQHSFAAISVNARNMIEVGKTVEKKRDCDHMKIQICSLLLTIRLSLQKGYRGSSTTVSR
jgi:hypothetical protein